MAFLEQFADDDRTMIVSLPYRVGLWLSTVDNTGGRGSQSQELDSLEKIIGNPRPGMFRSAFVHEVMGEVVARKKEWPRWAEQTENVLSDCRRVQLVLNGKVTPRDGDAYRENLVLIGSEVAAAFREADMQQPLFAKIGTRIRLSVDKLVGSLRGEVYESERLLSISLEEDMALSQLAAALRGDAEGVL